MEAWGHRGWGSQTRARGHVALAAGEMGAPDGYFAEEQVVDPGPGVTNRGAFKIKGRAAPCPQVSIFCD